MSLNFVLDTNIILHCAESIFTFQEHTVVIPKPVLAELDKFKKEQNEIGRNARAFSRYLDDLRKKGDILQGIPLNEEGGSIKVALYCNRYAEWFCGEDMTKDNQILACAMAISYDEQGPVVLVSNDTNMRISADIYGIEAQSYEHDKVPIEDLYTGTDHVFISEELICKIHQNGQLEVGEVFPEGIKYPNIGIILQSEINEKNSAICIYNDVMKTLVKLPDDQTTLSVTPRNTEQKFALQLMKDTSIDLVSMVGKAGSGKTLMAVLSGLSCVFDGHYDKMVLLKPIIAMDGAHELGFLPGDMDEKLKPWVASYADNLQVIMGNFSKEDIKIGAKKAGKKPKKLSKAEIEMQEIEEEKNAGRVSAIDELKALGLVECGSLEHIRGRSMPKQYIIIDEAQNLSRHAMKTIVTRAGVDTKIIIMGDIQQIDSPYLDASSNGLSHVVTKFADQQIAAHITMKKSERSRLAELAADIL